MTKQDEVSRDFKLKHRLRMSETSRVTATRERDEARAMAMKLAQRVYELEETVKKLEREAGK